MLQNTTFWVLVAFVTFVVLVWNTAKKAIIGALDARAERIRQEIEQAQSLREEAQAMLAQFQRKQRDALKEAEAIIAAAREEADRIRRTATDELESSLKRREAQAMEKIAQAETQALQQVRDLAVDLAAAATEKLLTETMDNARRAKLVDEAIKDLGSKLH